MTFTGSTDPARASSYLEMSGGDIGTAASLYFEHHPGSASAGRGDQNGTSATSGAGDSGTNEDAFMGDEGEVRAPDPTRRSRLMDPDFGDSSRSSGPISGNFNRMLPGGITEEMIRSISRRESGGGMGDLGDVMGNPFGSGDYTSGAFRGRLNRAVEMGTEERDSVNDGSEDDGVANNSNEDEEVAAPSERVRRLGDMFEAPTHLMYNRGGFQGARNVAKDARRWLLVNLQSDADFACHALNRDVWRNDLVENLVREGFIFWQSSNNASDGQTYAQRYNVTGYPHIAIIDPRTGRQMWMKEGWTAENPFSATMFAERAADFCSHHSFDKEPMVLRPSGADAAIGGSGLQSGDGGKGAAAVPAAPNMSEAQQLAAAIRASMMSDIDSDSDNSVVIVPKPNIEVEEKEEEVEEENMPPSFEEEIISIVVGEEPIGTDGVARVMIRMPDGKRLIRKFLLNDTVTIIYAFIAQCNDDAKGGKTFECKFGFPPKDLRTSVDDTIGSTGLAGDTITVRWK